jgi:hypothetical protein
MHQGFHEQAAILRYQELVDTGMREQFVASVLPPSANTPAAATVLRRQLGTLRVWTAQRLQGVRTLTRERFTPVSPGEQGAITASDEPLRWLSPYRLP